MAFTLAFKNMSATLCAADAGVVITPISMLSSSAASSSSLISLIFSPDGVMGSKKGHETVKQGKFFRHLLLLTDSFESIQGVVDLCQGVEITKPEANGPVRISSQGMMGRRGAV